MRRRPEPTNLSRFLALAPDERRRWIAAWFALLAADLHLRLAPAGALRSALAPPRERPGRRADREAARDLARAVASAAAHHLWPMSCLPRSLALWRLLRTRGIAARLRIGVRRESGLAAHAWVEVDDLPISEPQAIAERFLPLAEA